ncbi:SHOCT domain-containing protein [Pricia sp. S334]|jgi:putative membrane protein|uniref:SHOCT domain-containing protein n=3 Tax=Flavobacteriaceae TaxID=49546 RepID=A0ABU7ITR8_9FLAO|nr:MULTISPECIES: SHOCT domain-containing protein [Flavobacteriaceae]MDC6388901.1 SHOCT domain-containing protein [Maribacter sp. PR1]MDT7827260.1 SHOCT domain-containing protein [Pricia sp. S334]MEE1976289.1 SHOCT domain-containing protein [Maribacter cobaltidurans]|tara:strand:- start:1845 stop:2036 length:192 start_codon:yes stop_codon:yes gene_type:complete
MMMWWWILIPIILILAIFLFRGGSPRSSKNKENPMDILDNRFAKGEISKDEYEEQKRTINSKN